MKVVPFSDEVPGIPADKPTVFYGATRWIDTIYKNNIWEPGVFFNPESTCEHWLDKYGPKALNYGAEVTTLKELVTRDYDPERCFFIRPCSDQKEFAGCVLPFENIARWGDLIISDSHELESVPILVAEPVGISHEWRLFIVDGEVISGSRYRTRGNLDIVPGLSPSVIRFAENMIDRYVPAPVFVMDIGLSVDYYVIEIGCFNSAGFYGSDIPSIVDAVSGFVERGRL